MLVVDVVDLFVFLVSVYYMGVGWLRYESIYDISDISHQDGSPKVSVRDDGKTGKIA